MLLHVWELLIYIKKSKRLYSEVPLQYLVVLNIHFELSGWNMIYYVQKVHISWVYSLINFHRLNITMEPVPRSRSKTFPVPRSTPLSVIPSGHSSPAKGDHYLDFKQHRFAFPVFIIYMHVILQYIFLNVYLLLFNIVYVRFICVMFVVVQSKIFYVLLPHSASLCIYSIHSLRIFGCFLFEVFTAVNNEYSSSCLWVNIHKHFCLGCM